MESFGPNSQLEQRVENLSITQRQDAEKMRQEFGGQINSMRSEFNHALGAVKSDVMSEVRGVATAVSELGRTISDKSQPKYSMLIGVATILGTVLITYVNLATSKYDVGMSKVESRLDGHDKSIVPREEYQRSLTNMDRIQDRFNQRVDRINNRLIQTEIDTAVAIDRSKQAVFPKMISPKDKIGEDEPQ